MHWGRIPPIGVRLGQTKTIKKFLILPLKIDHQYRWLESTDIVMKFMELPDRKFGQPLVLRRKWIYYAWAPS